MTFDDNHEIHLERVDQNYPHLYILRQINEEAFPETERKDLMLFLMGGQPAQKNSELHAIVDGEVPVGFTIWYELNDNYVYLQYLAIDSQYRGRKYGTKTVRLIIDKVLKDKIIFGGVEALDPRAENYEQRISRVRFYKKNGFQVFDKIFNLAIFGKYQFFCTDPSVSEDALVEMIFAEMKRVAKSSRTFRRD